MVPTPRLIALAAAGAVALFFLVLALSWKTGQAAAFFLSYNGVAALLVMTDYLLTPGPRVLGAERSYEHRLSLGAANPIAVSVGNRSKSDLEVTVKDEPPVSFEASTRIWQGRVPAGSEAIWSYNLTPPRRGDYRFGRLNIRYRSRLGLYLRQCAVEAKRNEVRVYPNILEIRKYELLIRRGHLAEAGVRPARVVGLGTDFESLREYQVDDEFRRINWGATARRGRLVCSQYEVDRSQNIILVLDAGRMMSGAEEQLTKLDHAVNACLLLGYVAVSHGDRIGLAAFADQVKFYLPPARGRLQLQNVLSALYNLQPEVVESDYRTVCQYLGLKNRKRSMVFFFTDLVDEAASTELVTYCASLAGNHLVACVLMEDSSLVDKAGRATANSQEVYEKGVALDILRQREKTISILRNRGVIVIDVPAERLSVAAINQYLDVKAGVRI